MAVTAWRVVIAIESVEGQGAIFTAYLPQLS